MMTENNTTKYVADIAIDLAGPSGKPSASATEMPPVCRLGCYARSHIVPVDKATRLDRTHQVRDG